MPGIHEINCFEATYSPYVYDEAGNAYEVKRAIPTVAASGTTAGVAAVNGKSIVVMAMLCLTAGTATELTLKSASTAISPPLSNGANGGEVLPWGPRCGWVKTVAGEALNITAGTGASSGLLILYIEV